jgi:hypothetical protein
MWKRLLRATHPDITGDDGGLFVWARALREHVCSDAPEEAPRGGASRREPPRHHGSPRQAERVPYAEAFEKAASFSELTELALALAKSVGGPYAALLLLLEGCEEAFEADTVLYRQQQEGASYQQLARIAHESGMSYSERVGWYRLCESIPVSMRHASHILGRL